ncbi:site-specific DNA-methyltransferase [Conchiformibius kuhniae]|uniref:site-specific DNA-methyltransferase (adenine-specific) n=1 Tax=Conchiformibius kuhniae TaxID=211502 RepID=A0A8T9MWK7_9NEIS|nr:DNA methyltransferase [Conchiformibius kuhniae]UOP05629.1 site-specific DNA-methyltransferase [Conchiformibius kuhniae]
MDALKILQKAYANSVKMIYIDPPYNTGNDSFIYPDKFAETREQYAKRVGDKDENGYIKRTGVFQGVLRKNTKDNGHYHSRWLSMMLPRLHLAKTLLRDDGVIFISIDDNEQAQLKLLCDEVFGAENFVGQFVWEKKKKPSFLGTNLGSKFEYIACYAKSKSDTSAFSVDLTEQGKKYPFNNAGNTAQDLTFPMGSVQFTSMPDGVVKPQDMSDGNIKTILKTELVIQNGINANEFTLWGEWRYSQEKLNEIFSNKEKITISKIPFRPNHIKSGGEIKKIHNLLTINHYSVGTNEDATDEQAKLFGFNYFSYAKPSNLIKFLIQSISYEDSSSLILDFFSGSGTTAHAVMQLNAEDGGKRRYICVQLPEETDEQSEARKAGFTTVAEIAKERIRRAGKYISASLKDGQSVDTGFKVFKLAESAFKQWRNPEKRDAESLQAELALFQNVVDENASLEQLACELALRLGFQLTDPMRFDDKGVVWLNNEAGTRKVVLLLETFSGSLTDTVLAEQPQKVFALDRVFAGDDAAKANFALQLQDAGIEFETL